MKKHHSILNSAIFAAAFDKVLPLILLSAVIGALSGVLAHLARSMFYISAASPTDSIGLAVLLCLLVAIARHARRSRLTPS